MSGRLTVTRAAALTAGTAAALGAMVFSAPAASADTVCHSQYLDCSRIADDSNYSVYIARNWCLSGSGNGTATSSEPTCSSGGVKQRKYSLSTGGKTPSSGSGKDHDTFRVDAGWCYRVWFENHLGSDKHQTFNRAGKGRVWVKVSGGTMAHVQKQAYGHCP